MLEASPLPYSLDALAGYMSPETLEFHRILYGRYVDGVNARVDVETVAQALAIAEETGDEQLREQAAQVHNHANFFASMAPPGKGGSPNHSLDRALRRSLGTRRAGTYAWRQAAASVFGSGWVWLVADPSGALRIETTRNAHFPAGRAILVMDVWEHAYYLDYPTQRSAYAVDWLTKLANWDRASSIYDAAVSA